jgi:tRNA threonylcarbamoyl adenosine modification protein YeaZ
LEPPALVDCRRRGDKSRSVQGYSEDRSGVLVQTEVLLELRGHHKTPPAGKRCALKCQLPGRLFTPRPAPQAAVNYQAVALTVGSALAFGAGVPVLPIDTLLAVAEDARYQNVQQKQQPIKLPKEIQRFFVAMDARMDQVYTAAYEWQSEWQCVQAASVNSPEEICLPTEWKDLAFTTVGNAWDAFTTRWPAEFSGKHMHAMPTAQALLRLSPIAFEQGLAVPPEEALPLYIRDKVAQTTQERAQLKLPTTISP